jgi:hypothetical protein
VEALNSNSRITNINKTSTGEIWGAHGGRMKTTEPVVLKCSVARAQDPQCTILDGKVTQKNAGVTTVPAGPRGNPETFWGRGAL